MFGDSQLHPLETYDGAENNLHMEIIYRGKFLCSFANMGNYPFSHDNCNFTIYLKENRVAHLKLIQLGKFYKFYFKLSLNLSIQDSYQTVDLPAYTILSWNATEVDDFSVKGILVSLTLEHQFFSIFMATYLPTMLLNVINQVTFMILLTCYSS